MNLIKLGTLIHTKREEVGIPLAKAAQKAGIGRSTLWIIERGEDPKTGKPSRPSKDKLERLAEVLHMNQAETEELLSLADYHITRQSSHAPDHISAATYTEATQHPPTPAPAITEINGTVYFAHDGYIEAFEAKTGSRLWSSPMGVPHLEPQLSEPAGVGAKANEPQASGAAIEDLPSMECSELNTAFPRRRRQRRSGSVKPAATAPNDKTHAYTQPETPDQPDTQVQTPTASPSPAIPSISGELRQRVNFALEQNYPAFFLGPDFTILAANLLVFLLFDTTDPADPAFDKTSLLGKKVSEVYNRKELAERIIPGTQEKDLIRLLKTQGKEPDPATITGYQHLIGNIPGLQVEEPGQSNAWPFTLVIRPPSQLNINNEFLKHELLKLEVKMVPILRVDLTSVIFKEGYIVFFETSYDGYTKFLLKQEYNRYMNLPNLDYIQWYDEDYGTSKPSRYVQPSKKLKQVGSAIKAFGKSHLTVLPHHM